MSQVEMIECRTYCSMCDDNIAECEPRKMVPLSTDPFMRGVLKKRGFMRSHSLCAMHFGKAMRAAEKELDSMDQEKGASQ